MIEARSKVEAKEGVNKCWGSLQCSDNNATFGRIGRVDNAANQGRK